jgi:hypothetical protein
MQSTGDEVHRDLDRIQALVESDDPSVYRRTLQELGCLDLKFRGSGLKTAVASAVLAWLHRKNPPESALVDAANVLESDTERSLL